MNGQSGYLFRFDPKVPSVEVLERLTSVPSKRTGMFDKFAYGYLGLVLGADGHTLYYLTGSPLSADSKSTTTVKSQEEGSHLITYDISTPKRRTMVKLCWTMAILQPLHKVFAVPAIGTVYTLCYVARNGKKGIELISFIRVGVGPSRMCSEGEKDVRRETCGLAGDTGGGSAEGTTQDLGTRRTALLIRHYSGTRWNGCGARGCSVSRQPMTLGVGQATRTFKRSLEHFDYRGASRVSD